MESGIAVYRELICQFDKALKSVDMEKAEIVYEEAHRLAVKLNEGDSGILADDNAPGRVLARETAAAPGELPLWGQVGEFEIVIGDMRVRVEMDGMMGIGLIMPSFAVHAVEFTRPFLSETGYRSFCGLRALPQSGMSPNEWVSDILGAYIDRELKGKLAWISDRRRPQNTTDLRNSAKAHEFIFESFVLSITTYSYIDIMLLLYSSSVMALWQ